MEIIMKDRQQISFSKLKNGDVFYLEDYEDCNGYAMKILEEEGMDWNTVSLKDGELFYVPSNMMVGLVKGKFVED